MQVQTNSRYELLYPKTNVDQVNGYIKPWKVGDVRITSRTDLSDNWLLCNGSVVSTSDYPLLSENNELLTSGPDTYWRSLSLGLNESIDYITKFGDVYYCVNTSGNAIYTSSDRIIWSKQWNENVSGYFCQEIHNNDNIYFIIGENMSNDYAYLFYVQFGKNGNLVKRSPTASSRLRPQYTAFGCDSQYFYRLGDYMTEETGKVPYLYADKLDTLLTPYQGTIVQLTAPTNDNYGVERVVFVGCYENKMYAEYYTLKNDSNETAVFMEFQGSTGSCWIQSAVNQHSLWRGTYLDTETGIIASQKLEGSTLKFLLSFDKRRSFTEWGNNSENSQIGKVLYKKGYGLLFVYKSRTSYFYVFTGSSNVVDISSKIGNGGTTQGDFNFFDDSFWFNYRGANQVHYSEFGKALPTYTPADNLSAYIKAKEGE